MVTQRLSAKWFLSLYSEGCFLLCELPYSLESCSLDGTDFGAGGALIWDPTVWDPTVSTEPALELAETSSRILQFGILLSGI